MKLLALAALLFLGCSSGAPTTHVRGTGAIGVQYVEIRIENRNWKLARVYIRAAHSNIQSRLATVSTNGDTVVQWLPLFPEFELYVTFLASRDTWTSETWFDYESCLRLVIASTLVHSYVVPCYLGETNDI